MAIQNKLIQYILSPLAGIMDRFSEKTRDHIFVLAGMGMVLMFFLRNMSMIRFRFLIFFTIDCLFLGIMILCTLSRDMKPVKFRWPLAVCWFGVGFFMLLSGIINNVDYLPESMLFLVAYPIIFICWNNCDHTRIFRLLLTICRIGLIVFVIASFLFSRIVPEQYPGIFNNTNGAAYFLAVAATCLLIEIMYADRMNWKYIIRIVLFGLSLALLYYTNSRTGLLGVLVAGVCGAVFYIITHHWKDALKLIVRLVLGLLVCAVCVSNLVYVFQIRQNWPLPYLDQGNGVFYTLQQGSGNQNNKNPSSEDHNAGSNAFFDISGYQTLAGQKGDISNKTLDQYSTGRISIWKAYAKQLNMLGHEETPRIYIDELWKEISTTHMTILQIAFESGIPAGVLYLLFNLGAGFVTIWYAYKYKARKYAIMPLMLTLVFGVLSMLGSCAVSFWYLTTLYYYFINFPIIAYLPENAEKQTA